MLCWGFSLLRSRAERGLLRLDKWRMDKTCKISAVQNCCILDKPIRVLCIRDLQGWRQSRSIDMMKDLSICPGVSYICKSLDWYLFPGAIYCVMSSEFIGIFRLLVLFSRFSPHRSQRIFLTWEFRHPVSNVITSLFATTHAVHHVHVHAAWSLHASVMIQIQEKQAKPSTFVYLLVKWVSYAPQGNVRGAASDVICFLQFGNISKT